MDAGQGGVLMEYYESSNSIPELIDPLTGEVRPAGSFSNAEWNRIVKNNPDAATLILQLRRKENEIEELDDIVNESIGAGIGAVSAGVSYPLLNAIAPDVGNKLSREWRTRTWAKPDQTIYEGNRVVLKTMPDRSLELTVDGSTEKALDKITGGSGVKNKKEIVSEINEAIKGWPGYIATPGNRRFYYAVPEDSDGLSEARQKQFSRIGLEPTELSNRIMFVNDKRPGAELLGKGYHLIDDLVFRNAIAQTTGESDKVLKALRFAGALSAALGIGGLVGAGINLVGGSNE
jgi:hypothetical protein